MQLSYHASVVEHTKRYSSKTVDDFYRLFPVPGMGIYSVRLPHSSPISPLKSPAHQSGPGFGAPLQSAPSQQPFVATHDILRALVDWVEKGKTPEVIVAASWKAKGKGVERTRKLCRASSLRSCVRGVWELMRSMSSSQKERCSRVGTRRARAASGAFRGGCWNLS